MGFDKDKFDKKPFNRDNRDDKQSWRKEGFDKGEDKPKHITRTKSTKTDMFEDFAEFLFGENNERAADKYFGQDSDKKEEPRKVDFDKNKPRRERPESTRRTSISEEEVSQPEESNEDRSSSSETPVVLPWQKGRSFGADKSNDKRGFEKKDSWTPNRDDKDESTDSPRFEKSDSDNSEDLPKFENSDNSPSNDDGGTLPW